MGRTKLSKNIPMSALELENILLEDMDELPMEIKMAIRESLDSEAGDEYGGTSIPTGQSYKPTDFDDFPIGMYMVNKTGKGP